MQSDTIGSSPIMGPWDAWHLSPNHIMMTIPYEIMPTVLDDWRRVMKAKGPMTMLCTYRSKKGKEKELLALVKRHWQTLNRAGLVTKEPATVYRATDKKSGRVSFVEIFSWRDEETSALAHQTPAVMAIWEPMGPIMDSMELAVIEPVSEIE